MMSWDPHGVQRLATIRDALTEIGMIDFVHEATAEVWRANRERHEPEELFDDALTLGLQSARNLANRLYAHIASSAHWQSTGVRASREHGATVLHAGGLEVRLVKVPHSAGRRPGFFSDFDWNGSEARSAAAARNHAAYGPQARHPEMEPMFEIAHPGADHAVRACRDVFLVWGAELVSGLTAGWLGLPTTGADRWLAVTPLWWDEQSTPHITVNTGEPLPGDGSAFGDRPTPLPTVKLKPYRQEGTGR